MPVVVVALSKKPIDAPVPADLARRSGRPGAAPGRKRRHHRFDRCVDPQQRRRDGCNTNCPRNGRRVVFAARGVSMLRVAACGGVIYAYALIVVDLFRR
jgi:hypothetical protein